MPEFAARRLEKMRAVGPGHEPPSELARALLRAGYEEAGLGQLLRPPTGGCHPLQEIVGHLRRCRREGSPRALLARLFLLCQRVPREALEEALGTEATRLCLRRGLVVEDGEGLAATVDIVPVGQALFACDRQIGFARHADHVYPPGRDSVLLARLTARTPVARALDLGTGSGVQAILAAAHAQQVVGVDINPRALDFARFNAHLNGVAERCRFRLGNLYGPVRGQRFDLILANPPWVPAPVPLEWYRGGGPGGQELVRRIVRGLPEHLEPGGLLAMYVDYPAGRFPPYTERLAGWLGGLEGWGLAVLNLIERPAEDYVRAQVAAQPDASAFEGDFEAWMDSYEAQGIETIVSAVVYARRLPAGHPGWALERRCTPPDREQDWPVIWLRSLAAFHRPGWRPPPGWRPSLFPGARLWVESASGKGRLEFPQPGLEPLDLEPAETSLATRLEGPRRPSARALAALGRRGALAPPPEG